MNKERSWNGNRMPEKDRLARWQTIEEMYERGVWEGDIGEAVGLSTEYVCELLRRHGKRVSSPKKGREMVTNYELVRLDEMPQRHNRVDHGELDAAIREAFDKNMAVRLHPKRRDAARKRALVLLSTFGISVRAAHERGLIHCEQRKGSVYLWFESPREATPASLSDHGENQGA